MTMVRFQNGLPLNLTPWVGNNDTTAIGTAISTALDTASEQCYMIGHIYIDGGTGSKTLSAAGGGKISFLTGGVTWATAGSTLKVGINGVSTSAGPGAQANGTYSVFKTLVQGTDTITANTWKDAIMSSGTVTLTHGDLIAIVFEMTVRNGADAVVISCGPTSNNPTFPAVYNFVSPSTRNNQSAKPNAVITFDDGTLGWLSDSLIFSAQSSSTFNSDTAGADEFGNVFRLPYACKVDALWFKGWNASTTGGDKIILYSDPFGSPSVLASATIDYHQQGTNAARATLHQCLLTSEVSLSANTDYAVTVQPQTTSNTTLYNVSVSTAAHFNAWPCGQNAYAVKRLDNTGALAVDSTTKRWTCGVRISSLDDGTGSGVGMIQSRVQLGM